jgi:tetratricopeptide (TPR) repeat protein
MNIRRATAPHFLLIWFLFCPFFLSAQTTLVFKADDETYRTGLELFDKGKYGAAQRAFQTYLDAGHHDLRSVEAQYYVALTGLYLDHGDAEANIERFIAAHPDHPKAISAYYELGSYYANRKEYDKAIDYLKRVDASRLTREQFAETKFKLAYAYFAKQQFAEAAPLFNEVKRTENKYTYPASYYAGYISYRNGKYDEALSDLRKAAGSEEYAPLVPYMIVNVYYKQGKYDELIRYAETALKSKDIRNADEVYLLVAEAHYRKGDYPKAALYFKESVAKSRAKPAADIAYRLGYALYKTGDYKGAIEGFKPAAASPKDSLSQYAAYYLGNSYLQTGNKTFALNAFDQARKGKFSKAIAEEAAFGYAKVSYDAGNSVQATTALKDFVKAYPDSKHEAEANELLGEAYLNSNNYEEAIAHIERIKSRTPRIEAAYQRVTFNRGAELYNKDQPAQAITYFQKSLQFPQDKPLKIAANYWSGEAHSVGRNYPEAINQYAAVFSDPASRDTEFFVKSRYGIGYAYYNSKQYDKALTHFNEYAAAMKATGNKGNYADALIRLADCYYVAKDYNTAVKHYDEAIAANAAEKDYAYFQKGTILGLLGRDDEARSTLDKVTASNANSRYADNALYQKAVVDFEKSAYAAAIAGFTRLIEQKPNSGLVPNALEKRALAYNNLQKYNEAASDYKTILDRYPTSEVASSAILGLQQTLSAAGKADELSDYLARYRQANPDDKSVENLEFEAAKSTYFAENYAQAAKAFEKYLAQYPDRATSYDARYYLGDSYLRTKDTTKSMENFRQVIGEGRSQFVGRAVSRMADLELRARNYPAAITYFRAMLGTARSKKDQGAATLGLMDAYYAQKEYDSTRYFAEQVVTTAASPSAVNRALLTTGKTWYAQEEYGKATDEFLKTVNAAKDEYGAEAQYLIGEAQYKQKEYKQSLESLFLVNENFAAFEKWRGRAFLLIADNYVALDEAYQAKATLQSIIENASDKEIVSEAKARLKALDAQKTSNSSGNK